MAPASQIYSISWDTFNAAQAVKNDAVGLIVHRDAHHPAFPEHAHMDFEEITIVLGGVAINNVDGHDFNLCPGEVFVLPSGIRHSYRSVSEFSLVNLCYKPSTLRPFLGHLRRSAGFQSLFSVLPALKQKGNFKGRLHLNSSRMIRAVALVDSLEETLARGEPADDALSLALFGQFVARISGWYETQEGRSRIDAGVLNLARAVSYMETKSEEPVEPERLAQLSNMSLRNFYRCFQEAFGEAPSNYLNRIRIRNALKLMQDPRYNITEIALRVGFNDSNYFARTFRKLMKESPSEYRRRQRRS